MSSSGVPSPPGGEQASGVEVLGCAPDALLEDPYAELSRGCACCHRVDPEALAALEMLADLMMTDADEVAPTSRAKGER